MATRVLALSHSEPVWGAERVILQLAGRLRDRGFETTLASPAGRFSSAWEASGFEHVPLQLPDHRGIRAPDGDGRPPLRGLAAESKTVATWTMAVSRIARDYDVVHSHSLWGHVEAAAAGRLARRPVVLHLHDLIRPGAGRALVCAATALAARAIAISRAVSECVPASLRRTVRVIPNGIDIEAFHPGPFPPGLRRELAEDPSRPIVGIVGRVDPEKGVGDVVRAVAALGSPVQLVVIGAPSDPGSIAYRTLRQEAQRLLGGRQRFLDRRDDIPEVMRSLDVLVNASRAEPFGLSVLEAQASGTPVVAANSGGIPDFVTDNVTGLLFPAGDVERLTAALERLCSEPEAMTSIATAARAQATTRFGLDRQADAVAAVYHDVVGQPSDSD